MRMLSSREDGVLRLHILIRVDRWVHVRPSSSLPSLYMSTSCSINGPKLFGVVLGKPSGPKVGRTLESIADISALVMTSFTLPNHFAYATRVSGWFDMYMRRNEDFSATGSDIVEKS